MKGKGQTEHLSQRIPRRFRDVGGQYTRAGQHGAAYGTRGYIDAQRMRGYPPFSRPPVVDDGSGYGKNFPSGGGYGRFSRGAAKAARRIGGIAGSINPYVRGINLAFEVYDAYNSLAGFQQFQEPYTDIEGPLKAAGYSLMCDNGLRPLEFQYRPQGSNCLRKPKTTPIQSCGTPLQVIYSKVADGVRQSGPGVNCCGHVSHPRYEYREIVLGPGNAFMERMTFAQIWGQNRQVTELLPNNSCRNLPWPNPNIMPQPMPGLTRPVPTAEPQAPAVSETANGDQGNTRPSPGTRQPPYRQPSVDIPIGARTKPGTRVKPRAGWHDRRPPNTVDPVNPEKEKKSRPIPLGDLGKLYDGITEASDAADILAQNIPQCKKVKGLAAQLNCIWDNFGDLDINGAVADFIANQAEDKAVGSVHQAGKKARAPFGSSIWGGYTR